VPENMSASITKEGRTPTVEALNRTAIEAEIYKLFNHLPSS